LLQRCLTKNPNDRLRDIGDARLELTAVATGDVDSSPAPDAAPAQTGARWLALVAALALAAGTAAGWAVRGRSASGPAAAQPPATVRFEIPLANGERLLHRDRSVALSPDGRLLAYQLDRPVRLVLRPLDRLESAVISGTEGGRNPFFSPDGQWLGFWRAGQIHKIAVVGGAPIALCRAGLLYGASWGADGRIVYGQAHAGIFRVSAEGGEPELLIEPDPSAGEVAFDGPQLLADGRSLVFGLLKRGQNWNGASIVLHRLDTGERRVLVEGGTNARYLPSGHLAFSRRDVLYAMPLDLDSTAASGAAVPLLEGVWRGFLFEAGAPGVAFSDRGTLAYVPAPTPTRRTLVWVDRDGVEEPLPIEERFYQHARLSPDGRRIVVDTIDEQDLWVYELARRTMTRLTT
jgi:serine/threonine-protein kinase